ncbi:phosphoribosylglycinamide formyltransferase [Corynebacterium ulceribovis]|uniref:phosphoribosylglycinamide formyltransferase n=1 Tax=Corynebacterium ulceribovis TaxID=487732 RepID=UPI00037A6AF0|nr:phosphoribosylglycinamide formyltransferase [Corynebacterium ulceribovis]
MTYQRTENADKPLRVVVLASGQGSLLQALLDNLDSAAVDIIAVGSDKQCPAIERAEAAGRTAFVVPFDAADRPAWNRALAAAVAQHNPDLVVSAGFMRILAPEFLNEFPQRVINTHPALLPSFPGAHAVRDAMAHGVKVTGSTIHVVDTGVDTGPILAQEAVVVENDDDEDSLHERIKIVERRLLADVLTTISRTGFSISGRKASL